MIVANFEADNLLDERVKDESRASRPTCHMLQLVTLSHLLASHPLQFDQTVDGQFCLRSHIIAEKIVVLSV
jgi:hypothetical protein